MPSPMGNLFVSPDYTDDHWLWGQDATYMAGQGSGCRLRLTGHLLLCPACREFLLVGEGGWGQDLTSLS